MQTPRFWSHRGICAQVLRPLGAIYAAATARRVARAGQSIGIPVVCIGNINAGGTGKTPTVIAVLQALQARGVRPFVVSRGYGGSMAGPVLVDPARHSAAEVGDEPLLLSAFAPTVVAKDRVAGAMLAKSAGAGVIVLDDGLQNPSLRKDLSLVVVDAEVGFGNGLCLPAGPLREPVAAGLARTDIVLSIGPDAAQADFAARWGGQIAPHPQMQAQLVPMQTGTNWQGARVLAFAGIGRPDKFFATLRGLGAVVLHAEALADHAALPEPLLVRLLAQARALGAEVVTTEKDAARLPPRFRAEVLTLPVRLTIKDSAALEAAFIRLGL